MGLYLSTLGILEYFNILKMTAQFIREVQRWTYDRLYS